MDDTRRGAVRDVAAAHLEEVADALRTLDMGAVERLVARLDAARSRGATVYVAGNGGSAATASHWVNDLNKATRDCGAPRMRVMGLADATSWVSALANDEGYDRVFSEQLRNFGRRGDVLVVITCSGKSPNLVAAVECAQELGVETVGLLGFDGGVLKDRVDDVVMVPTRPGAYELVEDVHGIVCHMCTRALALPVATPSGALVA